MKRNGDHRKQPTSLTELIDRLLEAAKESDRVAIADILEVVGRRSFGPLLLVAGLLTLAPVIGDIPGVPTIIGVFVVLVAAQMIFHKKHIWLPKWILKRSVSGEKLCKALNWMRRPARFIDRLLHTRLTKLTDGPAVHVVQILCILIAAAMPLMEVVPFSANIAGAALTAFGLALIAHDGLLALIAFAFTAAAGVVIALNLP